MNYRWQQTDHYFLNEGHWWLLPRLLRVCPDGPNITQYNLAVLHIYIYIYIPNKFLTVPVQGIEATWERLQHKFFRP